MSPFQSLTACKLVAAILGAFLISLGSPAPARADAANPFGVDLTLRSPDDENTWIKPTFRFDTAWFSQSKSWAGNDREQLGDNSTSWMEWGVVPGLEGRLSLGDAGTLRARVSAVYAKTQFGLDAAGSNFDNRQASKWGIEDAYVGWTSGDLFPGLGKDAIDLSFGSQQYEVNNGFLFNDGGTDGGRDRGGFWLGLRRAFRLAGIARLTTGPWMAEAVYLRPNDVPNTSTEVAGANVEYTLSERAKVGAGYWNVFDSDDDRRDGLHVMNLRFQSQPLASVPQFSVSGEIARERNGKRNNSWGGWIEFGYDFSEKLPWKPVLSYRFASFSGDDGSGDNRAFDPLFYGFSDWGTWYVGEIAGEYVATNRNADMHTLRLVLQPNDKITANVLYHYFRLDEQPNTLTPRPPTPARAAVIGDESLAHEIDVAVDYAMTDYFTVSFLAATLLPSSGAKDFFGGNDTWWLFGLMTSLEF